MGVFGNLSDIPDMAPVEEGEYDLRIIKAQETKSNRTGRYGTLFVIKIVGEDAASNIMHTCWHGNFKDFQEDDKEKSDGMWRRLKEFIAGIGLDPNDENLEYDDFKDIEFTALVTYNDGTETDDDGNTHRVGPPKNEIGRIM